MQTLWARVAQVRCTCNCSICINTTNALARRATTTGPARRGVRRGDVFTVFSSTLALTAAMADSARKDARSRQWEKVIGEAKERVEAVEIEQQERLAFLSKNVRKGFPEEWMEEHLDDDASLESVSKAESRSEYLDWSWAGVFDWAARQDEERTIAGFENWKGPPLSLLQRLSRTELEKLLSDDRILRHFYGGPDCANLVPDPPSLGSSIQKLRRLEWSIAKLVLQLLPNARASTNFEGNTLTRKALHLKDLFDHGESDWRAKLDKANEKLEELDSQSRDSVSYDTFESPSTPNYDFNKETRNDDLIHLNTKIQQLLQEMRGEESLDTLVASICQHLLLSRTPPNIHTYNLLLVRFCQLGQKDWVRSVLQSMQESHVRPNEITHATALRFFTVTEDRKEFRLYSLRMQGMKRGHTLAHPDRSIPYISGDRYHRFGTGLRKIAEKARMNQEVYTSLIVGALQLFDTREAMYYYRSLIHEGWKPSMEILTSILQDCCQKGDWKGGFSVWQEISRLGEQATKLGYEWMLRLCRYCREEEIFEKVLLDGIVRGILPSRILDLPNEIKGGDVTKFFDLAEEFKRPENPDLLPTAIRNRIQKLLKSRGAYVFENALREVRHDDHEVHVKAQALIQDAAQLYDQRQERRSSEKSLTGLVNDIAGTTEEVNHETALQDHAALTYRLSAKIDVIDRTRPLELAASLYQGYKASSIFKLNKESRRLFPAPAMSGPFNIPLSDEVPEAFRTAKAETALVPKNGTDKWRGQDPTWADGTSDSVLVMNDIEEPIAAAAC